MTIFLWLLMLVVAFADEYIHTHTQRVLCLSPIPLRHEQIPARASAIDAAASNDGCLVVSVLWSAMVLGFMSTEVTARGLLHI